MPHDSWDRLYRRPCPSSHSKHNELFAGFVSLLRRPERGGGSGSQWHHPLIRQLGPGGAGPGGTKTRGGKISPHHLPDPLVDLVNVPDPETRPPRRTPHAHVMRRRGAKHRSSVNGATSSNDLCPFTIRCHELRDGAGLSRALPYDLAPGGVVEMLLLEVNPAMGRPRAPPSPFEVVHPPEPGVVMMTAHRVCQ